MLKGAPRAIQIRGICVHGIHGTREGRLSDCARDPSSGLISSQKGMLACAYIVHASLQ